MREICVNGFFLNIVFRIDVVGLILFWIILFLEWIKILLEVFKDEK